MAWVSDDGNLPGTFAQRFGGLFPSSLVVDPAGGAGSDGNGVLEPGETVEVRPSWRNDNGAAQSLAGRLTAIAGPGGATYTIADAQGSYGTVANASTGTCTDCYAVSLSNPATRPLTPACRSSPSHRSSRGFDRSHSRTSDRYGSTCAARTPFRCLRVPGARRAPPACG